MSRTKQTNYRKKARGCAKIIAKIRAGYICQKCGKDGTMHGAHIIPCTYAATDADPDNILCLCAGCHSMGPKSAHDNPVQFGIWFNEMWPGRYEELEAKAIAYTKNPFPRIDWEVKYKELLEIQKSLE